MSETGTSPESALEMNFIDESGGQQHWRLASEGLATRVQWAVWDGSNCLRPHIEKAVQ